MHLESIVAGGDNKKKTKDARCVSGPYGEKNKKKTKKKMYQGPKQRNGVSLFGPHLLVPISTFRVLWPMCVVVVMAQFGCDGGS